MKKTLILGLGLVFLTLFSLSLISADGLCRGYDGYYHDCDDSRYYDGRDYDDYYYHHGKYYPTRDYYYRDYYSPRYRTKRYDTELEYDDVEEYSRKIEYSYEDRYGEQKIKTTIYQELRL